ncbi:MAG: right-handed parallel beta-helix repeat-containing protein [Kiritimatiellae bacterium]|nr:right-handed parallel beta-helix repeat-containing protein [Kiritimatiellia bacterium]MDD3584627.1 right-handed parallel beta-helix repeat-containing protein [Kiritimatiellia bacterium]
MVEGASALYTGGGGANGVWYDTVVRNCSVTYAGYIEGSFIEGSGGGVWGATLYNCTITNNTAGYAGGGISGSANENCKAYDCLIGWNEAAVGGGAGVRVGSPHSVCQLSGCTIISNTVHALTGYAVEKGGGVDGCFLTNCVVTGNSAQNLGGGLNRAVAVDCTVSGNVTRSGTTGFGGGGAAESVLTNCIVTGNTTYYTGGGVFRSTAVDTLVSSNRLTATASSGSETTGGAGAAESTLLRCTVEDNDAGIVFFGGGLRACEATNCVIRNNQGPYGGGGYNGLFVRCIVSNNVATTRMGGGIYNATSYNCVVAFNIATNSNNSSWGRGPLTRPGLTSLKTRGGGSNSGSPLRTCRSSMRPKFSRCIRSTRRACGGVRDDFRSAITRSFQR